MSKEESIEQLGVIVLTTIALLDVTKVKLHPMVDTLNALALTPEEVAPLMPITSRSNPAKALERFQRKGVEELKSSAKMLREVADAMDTLIEGLEPEPNPVGEVKKL